MGLCCVVLFVFVEGLGYCCGVIVFVVLVLVVVNGLIW